MALRYALIEDEPPARSRLKRLVAELDPSAQCIGEAGDGVAGLTLLQTTQPDLLFLDIEFPPEGAFGLLRKARDLGLALPPIAFVTAFDQHALEAFRWAACDYLLKPLERERLAETLNRTRPKEAGLDLGLLMQALEATRRKEMPERFTVLVKGRILVLAWATVSHLRTENRLLFVHTPEGRFVLDRSLDELETLLAPRFFRTHRSAMVAMDAIQELVPDPGGTGELRLRDGARVPVSRERMPDLRARLGTA
ncbi:DNA-binding response regulator [Geothrix limicola]|uniref:DNA-binding response regulator n=1 Tax=Geothrix limicola TaxID=2927978 RepID=A0ABQ5QJ83_9BACT|nr:LytTR family DNA-binding domain-containing protein [Geothrix limicola]GLH74381.1 DNA-binding response regulator [Geothrix limicola]